MIWMFAILAAAAGQELPALPSPLSLPEALRIFRERGFDLLLAQQQVAAAQGDLEIAGAIPNPLLSGGVGKSFNYDPSTCAGCSAVQRSVGLSDQGAIVDLLVNKRGLRKEAASAALDAAKLTRADAQRTLEFQLKQQFLQAALASEQTRFGRDLTASTAKTRELMERRFNAGAISEIDLAKTQVAELEAAQQLDQAQAQLASAKAAVAYLLGSPRPAAQLELDTSSLAFRPGAVQARSFDELYGEALQARPDLQALESQIRRAEASLSLARRLRFPDVLLSVNYAQEGSGQNAIQPPTLTFGVQLPIPIFYQQQGEVRRAEADLRTQTIQRAKVRALVAQDVSQAFAAWQGGQKLVTRMNDRLLERAQRARDLSRVQYEKGASSLLELLDAERTFIAVHTEYVQDLSIYWTAVAQLEQAVGKELRQ
jgi:cobalt-zinc-cadmium efflux system outer membrane protein